MEVFVNAPSFSFSNAEFPPGSVVRDVLSRFIHTQGASSSEDFYVVRNGRLSDLEDPLQHGAVYHLEPRLRGGKGGFGSMLRALGAQIEKTTNREACRDLSGRRLRDVNHEKEMAEWLKKQAEREAEKEQRRLERLQRKLAEPKHMFTDPEYQRQCHDLSERLEDSVIKGLQVSSSGQVRADDVSAVKKRASSDQSEQPQKKKKKAKEAAAACFWSGPQRPPKNPTDPQRPPQTRPEDPQRPPQTKPADPQRIRDPQRLPESRPLTLQRIRNLQTSVNPQRSRAVHLSSSPQQQPTVSQAAVSRVDLSSVTSVSELEALGLDVLKGELMSRGLKCGGTLTERAARLFSVRGLTPDQIDPVLIAKSSKAKRK
ncbi:splicing regulator SDE2 [Tautogolabrus adspersus]